MLPRAPRHGAVGAEAAASARLCSRLRDFLAGSDEAAWLLPGLSSGSGDEGSRGGGCCTGAPSPLLSPPHGDPTEGWSSAGRSWWPCPLLGAGLTGSSATLKTCSLCSSLLDDVFPGWRRELIVFFSPKANSSVRAQAPEQPTQHGHCCWRRGRVPAPQRTISPKRALTTLPKKSDRPRGSRTPTL